MNMQSLMAQAQKMQRDITAKKEKIDQMSFDGKSELVDVVINGKKEVLSISINKEASLESDDLEVLEDMIKIALNDALNKVDATVDKELGSYGGGALGGLF